MYCIQNNNVYDDVNQVVDFFATDAYPVRLLLDEIMVCLSIYTYVAIVG